MTTEAKEANATADNANKTDPAADAAKNGGGNENANGGAPALHKPEGLADHLVGKSDQETIDNLYKAYSGARGELSKKKGIPEKIDDYKLDLPAEVMEKVLVKGEDGKDPVFEGMRGAFHEEGISMDAATRIASKFYGFVAEKLGQGGADPLAAELEDADADFKTFGGIEKAQPQIDASNAFLTGLQQSGKLSDDAVSEFRYMVYTGKGLKAFTELRGLLGDKAIPGDLNKRQGGEVDKSKAALQARVQDPRYRKGSKEFDPTFYAETEALFKEVYGGGEKAA